MLLSVTIVTRNRMDDLRELLESLREQTRRADEIIVVDNASTDGTATMLKSDFPEVKVLRSDTNLGCPGGRNVGLRAVTGQIAVCLDDDLVVGPDALALFAAPFDHDERLAVAFGQVVSYADGVPVRWVFSRGPRPQGPCSTYSFSGGVAALRLQALREVGYYADDFVRQCEEVDLSYRLLDRGWRISYEPSIVCRHKVYPAGRPSADVAFYQARNDIWTCWRNLPWRTALLYTLWKALRYPLNGLRHGLLGASVGGVLAGIAGIPSLRGTRRPVNRRTVQLMAELRSRTGMSGRHHASPPD